MTVLAVRADVDLEAVRAIEGPEVETSVRGRVVRLPLRLGEGVPRVDADGNAWEVYDDPRLTPEVVGRAAAVAVGRPYRRPGPPPVDPGPDFDPFEHEIAAQGEEGRRPERVRVNPAGLRPPPADEEDA